jgi:hypothetical protein
MAKKRRVRAIVTVVLEVESGSVWTGDTSFDQIAKQAEDGIEGMLLSGNDLALKDLPRRIQSVKMTGVRVVPEE